MELPTWKGAYYPCHVSPLSMRLFNHARGVQSFARGLVHYWVSTLLMSLGRGPDASNWMHYINNTISTTITLFLMCGRVHRRIINQKWPKNGEEVCWTLHRRNCCSPLTLQDAPEMSKVSTFSRPKIIRIFWGECLSLPFKGSWKSTYVLPVKMGIPWASTLQAPSWQKWRYGSQHKASSYIKHSLQSDHTLFINTREPNRIDQIFSWTSMGK